MVSVYISLPKQCIQFLPYCIFHQLLNIMLNENSCWKNIRQHLGIIDLKCIFSHIYGQYINISDVVCCIVFFSYSFFLDTQYYLMSSKWNVHLPLQNWQKSLYKLYYAPEFSFMKCVLMLMSLLLVQSIFSSWWRASEPQFCW